MPTIVHLSDLHFSDIEPGSDDALVDAVRSLLPDVIVVSGDLTLAGRTAEFRDARAFLDRLERPTLVVPGNHDIPAFNLFDRFLRPLGRYHELITEEREPTITRPDLCMLGLNTARPYDFSWNWSHGRFSERQIRAADDYFGEQAACPFKCLVVHHPFFLPDGLAGFRVVGRAEAMLETLGRRGVDLVLAGHLHRGFWRAHEHVAPDGRRHMLVVQASTATSVRRRDEPNSFNHLRLEGDTLTLTPWSRGTGAFERQHPTCFRRTREGWLDDGQDPPGTP